MTDPTNAGAGAALAAQWGLPRLGARPPITDYLRRLWGRRHFTLELARSRFRAENEQYRLGIAWVVIRPSLNALVYGTVFSLILAGSRSRPDNFVPYLLCGVFVFSFFTSNLSDGSKSIVGSLGLMRTLHFPRVVLPLSKVLQNLMALGPTMLVLAVLVLLTGGSLRWSWLLVFPALFLMFFFCLGVAMVAARLTIHVRDITNLIPFVNRLFFYLSGIFFSIAKLPDTVPDTVRTVLVYNPTAVYISLVRHGMLGIDEGYNYATIWLAAFLWAAVLCIGGFIFFWRAEERYGRT